MIDVIRKLIASPLDARPVAAILGGRLQWMDEDDYVAEYRLVGSLGPYEEVEYRRLKKRAGGVLCIELAPEAQLPERDICAALADLREWTPILPDPRDPAPRRCLAYRVPAGELRLAFAEDRLVSVAVSTYPVVAWGTQPCSP